MASPPGSIPESVGLDPPCSMGGVGFLCINLGVTHVSMPSKQQLQRETIHLVAASEMAAFVVRICS